MFKTIELINFKSHKHTIIHLCQGVNVIVGRGQSGKTNIKRGVEWLYTNRPLGNKVHSWWMGKGDYTKVSVTTWEGHKITIKKPYQESVEYSITPNNGERVKFRKVGANVPDKVLEILNINSINLQGQFDAPFLITSGTGEVSRAINSVVDLEEADRWLTKLNSSKQKINMEIKVLTEESEQLENSIAQTAHIERADGFIVGAEKLELKITNLRTTNDSLFNAITKLKGAQAKVQALKPATGAIKALNGAEAVVGQLQLLKNKAMAYEMAVFDEEKVTSMRERMQELHGHYVAEMKKAGMCPLCLSTINDAAIKRIEKGL